jgi:hypothetical protein
MHGKKLCVNQRGLTMGINIDLVADTNYDGADNGVLEDFAKYAPAAIPVLTVRNAVNTLLDVSGILKMDRLRIFGHGQPGAQWVGAGFGSGDPDFHRMNAQAIRFEGTALKDRDLLAQLVGRFTPGGLVELHGCSVGVTRLGEGLTRALAQLWNVRVRAATEAQFADEEVKYEGGYIEAQPNGTIQKYKFGVPGFVVVPPPPPPSAPGVPPKFHQVGAVVTKADWLSSIALAQYGDMLLWPAIYDKNVKQLPQGPNVIKPMSKFEIPPISGYKPEQLEQIRSRGRNWR